MCTIFKSAIRRVLPQATLVVDHFHLVQPANQTLTEVRRRVTVTHRGRRGRKGNREWGLRNRLPRSAAGTNRVIETVARDAYGFRNPDNQRLRTRCATTRRAVDTSMPANFVEPAPCNRVGWRHRTVSTAGVRLAVSGS